MWLFYTIFSVVTGSFAALTLKQLRHKDYNAITVNLASTALPGLIIFLLAFGEIKTFDFTQLLNPLYIAITTLLIILAGFISGLLYSTGSKEIDLSIMGTIENMRPFFTLVVSFLVFHNGASFVTMAGIVIMFLGLAVLAFNKENNQSTSKYLTNASLKIALAILIGSASSVFTKEVLNTVSPLVFAAINMTGLAIVSASTGFFSNYQIQTTIFKEKIMYARTFFIVLSYVSIMYAFKAGDITKIAPLVNMRSLVLMAIGVIVYKETDIPKKLLACVVTLIGAYFVVIG